MVIVKKRATFKVGIWKVKHRGEYSIQETKKKDYLEIKDQTCFKANDFLGHSAI